jgi:hypothetical protein
MPHGDAETCPGQTDVKFRWHETPCALHIGYERPNRRFYERPYGRTAGASARASPRLGCDRGPAGRSHFSAAASGDHQIVSFPDAIYPLPTPVPARPPPRQRPDQGQCIDLAMTAVPPGGQHRGQFATTRREPTAIAVSPGQPRVPAPAKTTEIPPGGRLRADQVESGRVRAGQED